MTANKTFYNFEKIEERGQKKFKKIIAHNGSRLGEVGDFENETLKLLLNLN